MNYIEDWPLAKQYLASHYFLSEKKNLWISESQSSEFSAFHLYISYGPWTEGYVPLELSKFTPAEKKKRIEDWKKVKFPSKAAAMEAFISMVTNLFPTWRRFPRLFTDFPEEWTQFQGTFKETSRVFRRERFRLKRRYISPDPVNHISNFQRRRPLFRTPRLNAKSDIKHTLYTIKNSDTNTFIDLRAKFNQKQDRRGIKKAENNLKAFLEEIWGTNNHEQFLGEVPREFTQRLGKIKDKIQEFEKEINKEPQLSL